MKITEIVTETAEDGTTTEREVTYENEVCKENALLEQKYADLLKEINEKSELMDTQISEKASSTDAMTNTIQE